MIKRWGIRNYFFTVLTGQIGYFLQSFRKRKYPPTSEAICRCSCRSTFETGFDLVPLVIPIVVASALIINFQEAYARLFSSCYSKQDIQPNLPSYRPMNWGTILRESISWNWSNNPGNSDSINCKIMPHPHPHPGLSREKLIFQSWCPKGLLRSYTIYTRLEHTICNIAVFHL